MRAQPETQSSGKGSSYTAGIIARAVQIVIMFAVQGLLLFGAAGQITWLWAWVFLGIYVTIVAINAYFMRTRPEVIAERGQPSEGWKDWDKVIGGIWGIVQFFLLPLVSGLDARFNWTGSLNLTWNLLGALGFAAGLGLFSWAMLTNTFFSTAVRIQSDRGHTVCRSGPYKVVRHPGYSGAIIQSLWIPVLLGSLWAFIPGILAAGLMVLRTDLEDRTLQAELPGYKEFAQEVHYRLIPGIW